MMGILIIFVFLLQHSLVFTEVPSVSSSKKYSRTVLESSNNPNLSVSPLPLLPDLKEGKREETNGTDSAWKVKGFSTTNVSVFLSEYPFFPLPSSSSKLLKSVPSNSSRIFLSKNETATLTIVVKQFRHSLMYLNFSYYVGSIPEEAVTETPNLSSKKHPSTKLPLAPSTAQTRKPTTVSPATLKTGSMTETSKSVTPIPAVGSATRSTFANNDTSLESEETTPEPIPIIHDMARKRRSVPNDDEFAPNDTVIATTVAPIELSSSQDEAISLGTTPTALKPESKVEHSLALDRAFEIIKTVAAAAINKKAPHISTGRMDALGNEVPTKSNGAPATPTVNPIKETNDIPNANIKHEKSSKRATTESTAGTRDRRHHHSHKYIISGGAAANNAKSGHTKGKGKKGHNSSKNSKKDDNVERITGKTNDEEEEHEDSGSSSSSSEETYEHEGGRKKISYKTWKASFEKKNRPPGLYVMVNDDIIFDNWEGLWDKHYVLGRWTGTNSKPLAEGMWNHTQLFMNWEDVPINDVKITFEWEPMKDNTYLILSDIVVSTVGTTSCKPYPVYEDPLTKINGLLGTNVSALEKVPLPTASNRPETQSPSIVIIKQGAESSDAWQIIKMGKAGSAEVESVNYKELKNKNVDNMTQAKLIGEDGNDNLLKAVLKTLQGTDPVSSTTKKAETATPVTLSTASFSLTTPSSTTTTTTPRPTEATTPIASTSTSLSTTPSTTTATTPALITTSKVPSTTPSTTTTSTTISTTSTPSTSTTSVQSSIQADNHISVASTPTNNETAHKRQRNEDRESALLVSVVTGSIAMAILILTLKKYYEISKKEKQRNQNA